MRKFSNYAINLIIYHYLLHDTKKIFVHKNRIEEIIIIIYNTHLK